MINLFIPLFASLLNCWSRRAAGLLLALLTLGALAVPANSLVTSKNEAAGIYGTRYNSVVQVPGRGKWYLVYHHFTYPGGVWLSRASSFHREVSLDKLEFSPGGSLRPVVPAPAGGPLVAAK